MKFLLFFSFFPFVQCLVRFKSVPILDYTLSALRSPTIAPRIHDITICRGYKSEKIDRVGVKYLQNNEWASTKHLEALMQALPASSGQDVVVVYGNCIYDPAHLEKLVEASGEVCVLVDTAWGAQWNARFQDPLKNAKVMLVQDGRIKEACKDPKTLGEGAMFMGVCVCYNCDLASLNDIITLC